MDTHEMIFQCARIREKLDLFRQAWNRSKIRGTHGDSEIFGASTHQFKLDAPLGEEKIAAWEDQAGVRLPDEYRAFLLHVGASGAGPYYGLSPLPKWDQMEEKWRARYSTSFTAPCLYQEGMEAMGEEWLDQVAGPDWEERFNNDTFDPHDGTLSLIEQGCGLQTVLVLNGPHRGRVVNAYWTDPPNFSPYTHFLDYYEGWLDTLLNGHSATWFGYVLRKQKETKR